MSADPSLEALIRLWRDKSAYYKQIIAEGGRGKVTVESCQQIVDRCDQLLAENAAKRGNL